jgi:hypothetical protein
MMANCRGCINGDEDIDGRYKTVRDAFGRQEHLPGSELDG